MRVIPAFQIARPMRWTYAPLVSPLLANRVWTAATTAVATIHISLAGVGIHALGCPFRACTGIRCPGCGLTEALIDLLHGRWAEALNANLITPLFLLLLALVSIAAVLPDTLRDRLVEATAKFETRTGATWYAGVAVAVFWFDRVFLFHS